MTTATEVDPLSVACPYCATVAGGECTAEPSLRRARTHKARVKLALAVTAHADPALDAFPGLGPVARCGLCGTPGLPQRHRIVDAIAGRLAAGESRHDIAADYGLPDAAVMAVLVWSARWPGAWQ